jgi:predicted MFS family arabinose efflux permease
MNTASTPASRPAPLGHVRPNSLLAALLLSVLATAGFFYVNIMAVMVDALVTVLHFSPAEAGGVASANVYGASAGALLAVFTVTRLPWRKFCAGLLVVLIAIDAISFFLVSPELLIAARFCHGVAAGTLVGTTYSVVAKMHSPDRTFGVLLFLQVGLAGLAIWFMPEIVRALGAWMVFVVLGAFSAVALALLAFVPDHQRGDPPATTHDPTKFTRTRTAVIPLALALVATTLFQGANMAVAAFGIPLGEHYGLDLATVSRLLGISGWLSMVGAIPVIYFATRHGRAGPVIGGMIGLIITSWLFHFSADANIFFAASALSGAFWGYVIPYILGMCADYDPSGRGAVMAGFFSKVGLASGPLCAGLLLKGGDYGLLIDVSVAVLALGALPCLIAAFAIDHRRRIAPAPPVGAMTPADPANAP